MVENLIYKRSLKVTGDKDFKLKYLLIALFALLFIASLPPVIVYAEESKIEDTYVDEQSKNIAEPKSELTSELDEMDHENNHIDDEEHISDELPNQEEDFNQEDNSTPPVEESNDEDAPNLEEDANSVEEPKEDAPMSDEDADSETSENDNNPLDEEKIKTEVEKDLQEEKNPEKEQAELAKRQSFATASLAVAKSSSLKEGDRNSSLIDLKKKLNKIGFGGISVTNYFGSFTTKRVKEFQKEYGIKVTGELNNDTITKINDIYHSPLQLNKRNTKLINLKQQLNHLGFGKILVTDLYGSFTEKKVKEYQRNYKLPVSGIIDTKTEQHIVNLFKSTYRQGGRNDQIKELKRKLNKLGFGGIKVSDLYGSFTVTRVKEFQQYYGLNATGNADIDTLKKVEDIAKKSLQQGKRNTKLIDLKHKLNNLGFGNITVTNLFGSFMTKKVKEYQRNYHLPVSGLIDEKTEQHINNTFISTYKLNGRNDQIKSLKRDLNKIGFGGIKVTELYGSFTVTRVKQFQQYYGIKATGNADLNTLLKVKEIAKSPFQQNKRHKDTISLKMDLNSLGFGNIKVTNLYGSYTVKKVKDFQKYYGLKVTGIADPRTWDKISELKSSPFQEGKRHNDTLKYKQSLNRLGFNGISVTTLYGSFMEKKVKEFQAYNSLIVNGIIDEPTAAKIEAVLASPLQQGKRHAKLISIKEKLNEIGYGKIAVTNFFGDFTDKKVKEFQRDNGLPVSGIIDSHTEKAIMSSKVVVNPIKIFIDPGHGGTDPGAQGFGLNEKDLTLDISKIIAKYLNEYKNVEIMFSRTTDQTVSLANRTKMANDWGADYFISVHINSCCGASGFESYVHSGKKGTADAKEKQNIIHDAVAKNIDVPDRGKKSADFHVLRESNMSAILLEYLFISTKSDNDKLSQKSYRENLGRLTAQGIAKAFNLTK